MNASLATVPTGSDVGVELNFDRVGISTDALVAPDKRIN